MLSSLQKARSRRFQAYLLDWIAPQKPIALVIEIPHPKITDCLLYEDEVKAAMHVIPCKCTSELLKQRIDFQSCFPSQRLYRGILT